MIALLRRRRFQRRRRGAVLAAALVCLLIVMAMLGHMLLGVVRTGRQLHIERNRRQCDLLLHAGIGRAARQLSNSADYSGETWELPAAEIIGQGDGRVQIEVMASENGQPARLHVIAEYPTGSERSVRRSRIIPLATNTPETAEE